MRASSWSNGDVRRRAAPRRTNRCGLNDFVEAACVLGMMLSQGEVLVIVIITAVIVFIIARRRTNKK